MFSTGSLIRRYRTKAGMSQTRLADALGVSAQTVSKWESGTHLPDPALISSIARILQISMVDLAASYFGVTQSELKNDSPVGETELLMQQYRAVPWEDYTARLDIARKLYQRKPERYRWMYINDLLLQKENRDACLAEARELIRARLAHPQCDDNEKYGLLASILYAEEDDRLDEWLSCWPPDVHFVHSKDLILAVRLNCRGEEEAYLRHRSKRMQELLNDLYIYASVQNPKRIEEYRFVYDILHLLYGDRLATSPTMQISVCMQLAILCFSAGEREECLRLLGEAERRVRELMDLSPDSVISADHPLLVGRTSKAGAFRPRERCHAASPHDIPEEMQADPACAEMLARIRRLSHSDE